MRGTSAQRARGDKPDTTSGRINRVLRLGLRHRVWTGDLADARAMPYDRLVNLIASVVTAIAMLIATPAACPHALAAGAEVKTDLDAHGASIAHAAHDHHDHHEHAEPKHEPPEHAPSEHAMDGCSDDCDGGVNCSGCAIALVAILADAPGSIERLNRDRSPVIHGADHGFSPALDTPPPRA